YTQLTGLLKNKALNELNGWVKEGVLDTIGSGSHKIYVRANTKKE
ncbi:MAG: DNA-binding protein, partial [Lachnospiraceae bacterium]